MAPKGSKVGVSAKTGAGDEIPSVSFAATSPASRREELKTSNWQNSEQILCKLVESPKLGPLAAVAPPLKRPQLPHILRRPVQTHSNNRQGHNGHTIPLPQCWQHPSEVT